MNHALDHVALVVHRIEPVMERLGDLERGPIEEFPREGTREVYLGSGTARLLLMQPTRSDGPYARALAKRGAGLHHVAIRVPDLDAFLADVRGWLLVPACVRDIAATRTAWFARPGVATLLEVAEGAPDDGVPIVERVELPGPLLVDPRAGLVESSDGEVGIAVAGVRHSVRELLAGAD
ncbi:MAG: VOC family protein [Planctomycetota bacterium]